MIRFAVIGAGNVARRFCESLSHHPEACLYAIYGRNIQKLEVFRKMFPCEKVYTDLDEVLSDENVDAVYVSLPNSLHRNASLKAMKKGIPVLCEKPAVLSSEDMKEIMDLSKEKDVLFMEALKTRFSPLYRKVRKMVKKGVIGEVKSVDTELFFAGNRETMIIDAKEGGILPGCGVYGMSVMIDLLEGVRPAVVFLDNDPCLETSARVFFLNDKEYPSILATGIREARSSEAVIKGEKGSIRIPDFHRAQKACLITEDEETEISVPFEVDDFYDEIDHFVTLVKEGKRESYIVPLSDSMKLVRLVEEIRALSPKKTEL